MDSDFFYFQKFYKINISGIYLHLYFEEGGPIIYFSHAYLKCHITKFLCNKINLMKTMINGILDWFAFFLFLLISIFGIVINFNLYYIFILIYLLILMIHHNTYYFKSSNCLFHISDGLLCKILLPVLYTHHCPNGCTTIPWFSFSFSHFLAFQPTNDARNINQKENITLCWIFIVNIT